MTCFCNTTTSRYVVFAIFCFCVRRKSIIRITLSTDQNCRKIIISVYLSLFTRCWDVILFYFSTTLLLFLWYRDKLNFYSFSYHPVRGQPWQLQTPNLQNTLLKKSWRFCISFKFDLFVLLTRQKSQR